MFMQISKKSFQIYTSPLCSDLSIKIDPVEIVIPPTLDQTYATCSTLGLMNLLFLLLLLLKILMKLQSRCDSTVACDYNDDGDVESLDSVAPQFDVDYKGWWC